MVVFVIAKKSLEAGKTQVKEIIYFLSFILMNLQKLINDIFGDSL